MKFIKDLLRYPSTYIFGITFIGGGLSACFPSHSIQIGSVVAMIAGAIGTVKSDVDVK